MVHLQSKPVFLTWRLNGSLVENPDAGPCHLRNPEVARMVVDAIYHYARRMNYFDLHAFVVMSNHVRLLVTPRVPVESLACALKDLTAREATHRWKIREPFWQEGEQQLVVRSRAELERIASAIEMEPVAAGMVETPGEFPWTSAVPD